MAALFVLTIYTDHMTKFKLNEAINFSTPEGEKEYVLYNLTPLSQQLISAARSSPTYKKTLDYLNTLPKDLNIEAYIALSGRNLNKAFMHIGEETKENVQSFFKEMTGNLTYLFEDRIIADTPIYREISIDQIRVGQIPQLQNEISIFYKITLILPPELPEGQNREGYQQHVIYGNLDMEKAFNVLQEKVSLKKAKEDSEQEQEIAKLDREDRINKLPYDRKYDYFNLNMQKMPDLTGPFLLKWV